MTHWQLCLHVTQRGNVEGKIILIVDKFGGNLFGIVIMSGDWHNGDNPLHTYSPLHLTTLSPTFHHHYGYVYSVMTTFFPLTVSWEGFFYYTCFPDKKGGLSSGRGETTVRSVIWLLSHSYNPLQRVSKTNCNEWTICYLDPNEVTM